ncbi:TIGR03862 family flavoprotein [Planktotalea frisia]|uniref:TIGR03862 family flavoprotein n=1 Tax=Planktotalea frisia TaxID=696762 RepID=UPI0023526DE0|nr:TIGR03862 family flavoprotein [Planktotalea frisia]
MKTAFVIGGGPAGLMAAQELALAGASVALIEAKPSLGRKFLMAGKSGLNLTMDEPIDAFTAKYGEAGQWLSSMLHEFGPNEVSEFATRLGQTVFTGSSGRVFPQVMKASPMLRAWIKHLDALSVTISTKWRWTGWDDGALVFETPDGPRTCIADVVVLALGGKSWARLGSDGQWATHFEKAVTPFGPSNSAISIEWSAHVAQHFGTPLKAVTFKSGPYQSRGEAVISKNGLEGGGVYSVSRGVREGHPLFIDLKPDWSTSLVEAALQKPKGKTSTINHLRKVLKLQKHELALLNEWARPLPSDLRSLADTVKHLKVADAKLRPIDEAISTSGGIRRDALDESLMLKSRAGVFCAGEMLDWEAPTGGYLLTACFATGRTAGRGAAKYLGLTPAP